MKKKKIGILSSVFLPTPYHGQGALEKIAWQQAEGLVKKGYKVTLFGTLGSKTSAKLVTFPFKPVAKYKLKKETMESSRPMRLELACLALMADKVLEKAKELDIIFVHVRGGEILVPISKFLKTPFVFVLHLPLFKELIELFRKYKTPLISIGEHQRKVAPDLNFIETVYNGVDLKEFRFSKKPKDYFLYAGSIGKNKNPGAAILACKKAKEKLILVGKIKDKDYFQKEVLPFLDKKRVKYLGEVKKREMVKLYQGAKGFLFPILWPEPFGLVMIEAMACGTPVIAFGNGAVPEVVKDGETGFIVKNINEMAKAIKKIGQIDREKCRKHVKDNFTVEKMIDGYEKVIEKLSK